MSRGIAEGTRSSVTRYCGRRCGGLQGFEAAKGQFRKGHKKRLRASEAVSRGIAEGAAEGYKGLKLPKGSFGAVSRGIAEGPRSSVTRYCGRRCGGLQGFEAAKGQFRRVIIKRDFVAGKPILLRASQAGDAAKPNQIGDCGQGKR